MTLKVVHACRALLLGCIAILGLAHCGANAAALSPDSAHASNGIVAGTAAPLSPVRAPNKCIDVRGAVQADGTPVQLYDCNGTAAQQWSTDGGMMRVFGNKCIQAAGSQNGALLQIASCTGAANQMWTLQGQTIQLSGQGLCVDVPEGNTANTTQLQAYECVAGNVNQSWQAGTTTNTSNATTNTTTASQQPTTTTPVSGTTQPTTTTAPTTPTAAPTTMATAPTTPTTNTAPTTTTVANPSQTPTTTASTAPAASGLSSAGVPAGNRRVYVQNHCSQQVWVGTNASTGNNSSLASGQTLTIDVANGWSGRIWGKTGCGGGGTGCVTGDNTPWDLAEFAFNAWQNMDFYDLSNVDGYNIPMGIAVVGGGTGGCQTIACNLDSATQCPPAQQEKDGSGNVVACHSPCQVDSNDAFCCRGGACQPTVGTEAIKNVCPNAYSYASDDATSTFTCTGAVYAVTFCP